MIIHQHRLQKALKKIGITVGVLLVLIIGGGIAYVYFGSPADSSTLPEPALAEEDKRAIPNPKPTDPNGPVSAAVQYLASPVQAGTNTSINVATATDAKCTIVVAYNNIVSKDSGLIPKTADIHGSISWTWTVDKTATPGKWPVKVTCVRGAKSGFVQADLVVTK